MISGVVKTLANVIFSEIGGYIKKFSSVPKLVAYEGNRASPVIQNLMGITSLLTCVDYQKKRVERKDHLNAIGRVCHKILAIRAMHK